MQYKPGVDIIKEFAEASPWLVVAAHAVDGYFIGLVRKKMVITCISRDIQRQLEMCEKHKFKSDFQHCMGEALDIRPTMLTEGERQAAIDFVNKEYGGLCHLAYHPKGTAPHLHLRIIGEKRRGTDHLWAMVKNAGIDEEKFKQYFTG